MDITSWLRSTETPDGIFAERIGVSRQALHRYKVGERTPRPSVLSRIREATNGAVTANDFVPATSASMRGE